MCAQSMGCVSKWRARAVLIARIYGVFPQLCPMCGGQVRLIAFVTEGKGWGVHIEPDWDLAAPLDPDYEVDQRINW